MERIRLYGRRFGRWLVLGRGTKRNHWVCRCDCGTERQVMSCNLTAGKSSSCGCTHAAANARRCATHGHAARERQAPEYKIWLGMRSRCQVKTNKAYRLYGARGITVCERWRHDFAAFLADMGPRPSSQHSIDRIDNDGDYEPGNCRWATVMEQANNKRGLRLISHHGKTRTLSSWAREIGVNPSTLSERIEKRGVTAALSAGRMR